MYNYPVHELYLLLYVPFPREMNYKSTNSIVLNSTEHTSSFYLSFPFKWNISTYYKYRGKYVDMNKYIYEKLSYKKIPNSLAFKLLELSKLQIHNSKGSHQVRLGPALMRIWKVRSRVSSTKENRHLNAEFLNVLL